MRFKLLLSVILVSVFACKTKQEIIKTIEPTPSSTPSSYHQVHDATRDLQGEWILVSSDDYLLPDILEDGDEIHWSFNPSDHTLTTSKSIRGNDAPANGQYRYWVDNCLLQINQRTYLYTVHSILDDNGQEVGKDLTIYENTDPGMADNGSIFRLRSMDTFFACPVSENPEEERMQIVSLIDGIVLQTGTDYPVIEGKWLLTGISAFTTPSNLPDFMSEKVIWDFGQMETGGNELTIIKSNAEIKNDHSLKAGKYNLWTNDCIIKIGSETYSYQLFNDGSKERLELSMGLSPAISDKNVFKFVKI